MQSAESKPLGYRWLARTYGVATMPHWRESFLQEKGSRRTLERDGRIIEYLPANKDPGPDPFAHLEFALKREGLHLELLRKVLPQIPAANVIVFES